VGASPADVDADIKASNLGAGLYGWSGLLGDGGPSSSTLLPGEVQAFWVEAVRGVDVTTWTVEGPELLGLDFSAIDEVLEAAGVVAPHGSTDVAVGDRAQSAVEVLWRVECVSSDAAVEGAFEDLVDRGAVGGVVVAFGSGGLDDA